MTYTKTIVNPGDVITSTWGNNIQNQYDEAMNELHRGATLVVAAVDASAKSKAAADYVCDGTDDHEEIIAAIAALPATGGRIILTEGNFTINPNPGTGAIIALPDNTTLEGQGAATVIKFVAGYAYATISYMIRNSDPTNGNTNIRVKNLALDGSAATNYLQTGVDFSKVSNAVVTGVYAKGFRRNGISVSSGVGGVIESNFVEGCAYYGIYVTNTKAVCAGNVVTACSTGIMATADDLTVSGNIVRDCTSDGINAGGSNKDNIVVTGNSSCGNTGNGITTTTGGAYDVPITITGNICNGNGASGIRVYGSNHAVVTGNVCKGNTLHGINLSSSQRGQAVVGNACTFNGQHGIYVDGGFEMSIADNTCSYNSTSSNTSYDNICLLNADDCSIQGNICRRGAGANRPRYGINVSNSSCDRALIANNDCCDGGTTAGISDSGTSTSFGGGNRNKDGTWSTTPN